MSAPSAYVIGKVLEIVREMRERLQAEPGAIETDDDEARGFVPYWEEMPSAIDPADVLRRLLRAAIEADVMTESISLRIQDLRDRARRYQHRADENRASLALVMGALELTKFVDTDGTASLRPNRGGAVIITDEAALTDEYVRVTRSPDKAKIGADLKDGLVVPGATLSQGGPDVLSIRSK
jgi:hypothetical protein